MYACVWCSGRLVSGMLGTRLPKWTLFGDTMNTAARMESTCRPNCIQVSSETRALLAEAEQAAAGVDPSGWHSSGSPGDELAPGGEVVSDHGRLSAVAPLATREADGQWYATGGVEVKGGPMAVLIVHKACKVAASTVTQL